MNAMSLLKGFPIVPVVVLQDAADAAPLAKALLAGGLGIMEVTFRTAAAPDAIAELARDGEVLVGAGTVVNVAQVDQAVAAGARFLVSPGLSRAVVRRAQELDTPIIPGTVTPSEIMAALDLGIDLVKFFPAGVYGGVSALKALAAPFPNLRFVPTGGISAANATDYLKLGCVAAIGGSWMVAPSLIAAGDFAQITALTRQAVDLAGESAP